MKFTKEATAQLDKGTVAAYTDKRSANRGNVTECVYLAAARSVKAKKPMYVVSNCTGWHILTALNTTVSHNGYIEIDGYTFTRYTPNFK